MRLRNHVLASVFAIGLTFSLAASAAPKKGKKAEKKQEAQEDLLAPSSESDLTTLDSTSEAAPAAAPTPRPAGDDPALYDLKSEIPLYKKNETNYRLDDADPFVNVARHTLHVGIDGMLFNWKQENTIATKDNGVLPGLQIRFDSAPFERRFFFGFLGAASFLLKTKYEGQSSDLSAPTPISVKHSTLLARGEGWIGTRVWKMGEQTDMKIYGGLGYRYWSQGASADGTGSINVVRQWVYAPLGIRIDHATLNNWQIGLDVSARPAFLGRARYKYSDVNATFADSEAVLGAAQIGYRVSVPISFQKVIKVPFTVTPWFESAGFDSGPPAAVVNRLNGAFVGFLTENKSTYFSTGLLLTADLFL